MRGELIYIPSATELVKFTFLDTASEIVAEGYTRTKKPINVLLLTNEIIKEKYLKVLYQGDSWYVNQKHTRKVLKNVN